MGNSAPLPPGPGWGNAPAEREHALGLSLPRLGRLRARSKLAAGQPLLHAELLDLDVGQVLAAALGSLRERAARGEPGAAAAADALDWRDLDLPRLIEEAFVAHADHVADLVAGLGGPAASDLAADLEAGVRPLLRAAAARLRHLVELADWARPYCPVCGAAGEARPSERLRCPRCLSEWDGVADPRHPGFRLELGVPAAPGGEDWADG